MPYYTEGDYYGRGDYYQGDGIFSAIGKGLSTLVKTGVKVIGGAVAGIPKGPAGVIAGGALGAFSAGQQNLTMETLAAGGSESAYTPALMAGHAAAIARGGMPPQIMPPMGGLRIPATMMDGMMRGLRWNKSTYATRGGGTSRWPQMIQLHPKGTVMVKSRRMNVANPRALRRGLRRAAGFVKLARRAHVRLAAFTGRGKRKKK
jgi:hypothetical protein